MVRMPHGYRCAEIVVVLYVAYGLLGIYVGRKLHRLRIREPLTKRDRVNPEFYSPDARLWLERNKTWEKASWPVWIGGVLAIWFICGLF
jgi:hypothetical protein